MDNSNYILVSYLNENELKEEVEVYASIIRDIEKILRERNLKYTIAKESIIDEKLKDSISKDKIREKLDYYTMSLKDDDFADDEDYNKMKYGKQVLEELLEEE